MPVFLASCDYYNFSEPQPVDKENIYEFPIEFHGKWLPRDTFESSIEFTAPLDGKKEYLEKSKGPNLHAGYLISTGIHGTNPKKNEDSSFYIINKKNVWLVIYSKEKIVTGAWPRLGKNGEFIYPAGESFLYHQKEIKYDSLKRPSDTTDNYILNGGYIYEVYDNGFLNRGYKYHYDHDTIIVEKKDTLPIDLGQNAFLRKLNAKSYVLNIRNSILGDENNWWRLIVLDKKGNDTIIMRECSSKTGNLPCMFYAKNSKSDIFYFNCKWTSGELLSLIDQGYFNETEIYHRGLK